MPNPFRFVKKNKNKKSNLQLIIMFLSSMTHPDIIGLE